MGKKKNEISFYFFRNIGIFGNTRKKQFFHSYHKKTTKKKNIKLELTKKRFFYSDHKKMLILSVLWQKNPLFHSIPNKKKFSAKYSK